MSGDNVEVAIRVRPLIARELKNKDIVKWQVRDNVIYPRDTLDSRSEGYVFDHIFDTNATNEDLYKNVVHPLVLTCVEGYHCTIFTYGQTSSGKTHTMHGSKSDPGIITRVVDQLFDIIDERRDSKFLVRVAYIEIYNEKIYDLLKKDNVDVKLRENFDGDIIILSEELVTSTKEQILEIINVGKKNRKIYSTKMNINSSRSHTIFRIIVENSERSEDGSPLPVKVSHFNLVDLAGSERVAQTKATGQRLVEGAAINKSLSTLTLVISQLTDENSKFKSYRDSKLTLILRNALGGNAKTLIIANITPASLEDTHSTLSFARRAKNIKNQPVINTSEEESILLQQQLRIKELERELLNAKKDKVQISELIELNNKAFAKGSVKPNRRHTISKTTEINNIFQVSTTTIPLTQFEKSLLRVARTNAIETQPSSSSKSENIPILPFEAQLNLSVAEDCEDLKQEIRPVTPDISIADYSVNDIDLESDTDEDLEEFLELEKQCKTPIKDLQKELKKVRTDAATATQQYSQQVALNIFLKNSNQKLTDNLIDAKKRIIEYENKKQTPCQMYNSVKEIELLTKQLEEEKIKSSEAQEELKVYQEEHFQLLKEKEFFESQIADLNAKIDRMTLKQSEFDMEPKRIESENNSLKINDNIIEHEDMRILTNKIEQLTNQNIALKANLNDSENQLIQKQSFIDTLKEKNVSLIQELKSTEVSLEKAEDDLLDLSQNLDDTEKKMMQILKQNKVYQSLIKFKDTYHQYKLDELKTILSTMKNIDPKKVSEKLFRVKSLPSLIETKEITKKASSLQNINLCVHESSFKEISDDLMSLSQVLSRGPGNLKNIEMEESLNIAKNRITTLQSQIDGHLFDVESSNNENIRLKQRIRDLENEIYLSKDEVAVLKNQIKNLDEKEISFGKKYAIKMEEYKELNITFNELKKHVEDIQTKIEIEKLKQSQEKIDLINKLESAEIVIQTKTSLIESNLLLNQQLEATILHLQSELDHLSLSTETQTEQIRKLEKEIADLQSNILVCNDTTKNEMYSLKQRNKQMYNKYKEVFEFGQIKTETCKKLQKELDDLKTTEETRNQLNKNKLKEDQERIDDLTEKLNSLQSFSASNHMITQCQQKLTEVNKENEKLQTELSQVNQTLIEINKENKKLQADLFGVNQKLTETNKENEKLQTELTQVNQKLIEINKENKKLQAELIGVNQKLREQKQQSESFEKQINDLLDKNKECSKYLITADQTIIMRDKENQKLHVQLRQTQEAFEKRYNMLVTENKQLLRQEEIIQEKCNKLLCERGACLLNLKSSQDINKTLRIQLEHEKIDLISKLQSLEILIKEQETLINNYRDDIQKLSLENDELQKRIKSRSPDQQFKIKKYMQKLSELENENKCLTETIRSLENISKQNKVFDEREKAWFEQKKQLQEQLKAKENLDLEIEQLRSELHTSNKELRRYKQRCECESSTSSSAGVVEPWKTKRRFAQDTQREREQGKDAGCPSCKKLEMKIFNLECELLTPKEDTSSDMYYKSRLEVCDKQINDLRKENVELKQELKDGRNERDTLMAEMGERDKQVVEYKKLHEKYQQLKAIAVRRNEDIRSLRSQLQQK